MLNYSPVIKNEIKQESVSVKEISPVMKINLRGKKREFLTNVGKNLNMILPTDVKNSLFFPLKLSFIIGEISLIDKPLWFISSFKILL